MFARLLTLFILLPLADLVLIIMLLRLHWGLTLLWVLLSGVMGAWYVRRQGMRVLGQLRESIHENRLPTDVLIEGVLVVVAGALLVTPGLITDVIGFSILLKPCRGWYRKRFVAWIKSRVHIQTFQMGPSNDADILDADILDATVVRPTSDQPSGSVSDDDSVDQVPLGRIGSNSDHSE